MTFYEAALRVLEASGAPLHVQDITKQAIDKGLLSHVGKTPEVTMLARLAAMARRPRDRKLMVTAKDTFALTDWMLAEDPEALKLTGVVEPNPEENLPPLRPVERHPEPRAEFERAVGRQGDRKRRDDEGRRRRYPPIAEVAFEVLTEAQGGLVPTEVLSLMRSREMASDELSVSMLLEALAEANQRRIDDGRRPQFGATRKDGAELQVMLEAQGEGGAAAGEVQAAFCQAVGLPFENGRLVSQKLQPPAASAPAALSPVSPDDLALVQTAKTAVRDAKRTMARVFRRRLSELEMGPFEKACVKLLHAHHFRELKVAKRSKDGPVFTARRKDGSLELRFAVRLLKGGQAVERRHVQELRRDLGHYAAHMGLIISTAEARGDARSEALGGGALVMLWCGDHLAEKFFEGEVGVSVTRVELYDLDEAFFAQANTEGAEATKRREERHREKAQQRPEGTAGDAAEEGSGEREGRPEVSGASVVTPSGGTPVIAARASSADADDEGTEADGDEEGGEAGGASAAGGPEGQADEPGRRRRRRRRRRGQRPGGQPAGEGGAPRSTAPLTGPRGDAPTGPVTVSPPPPPPPSAPVASNGGGGEAS